MPQILTATVVAVLILICVDKINRLEEAFRTQQIQISHISKKTGKLYIDMFRVKEHIGMNHFVGEQLVFRPLQPPHPALYKWRPFGYRAAP